MAKSRKLPYMPFYHGDWKKDIGVQALSFHDRAVWFEMLMLMHESEQRGLLILNGKPMTHEMIARLINLDNQIFKTSLQNIIENGVCGVREDGTIFSRKMVRDEELSVKRTISGLKGGNPNLVNQKNKHDSYPNAVNVIDIVNEDEDLRKRGYVQHKTYKHCWYSPIDIDQWKPKGREYLQRCFEKLNGWIEQKRGDPIEFQERVRIGKFGLSGAFQSWVFSSVSAEKPKHQTKETKQKTTIAYNESMHPSLVAERRRAEGVITASKEVKNLLEGITK